MINILWSAEVVSRDDKVYKHYFNNFIIFLNFIFMLNLMQSVLDKVISVVARIENVRISGQHFERLLNWTFAFSCWQIFFPFF